MKTTTKKKSKFDLATKPQRRVMIAKDVIAQLNTKQLVAASGSYVALNDAAKNIDSDESVKSNYAKIKKCNVCALGACLMSATKFGNILSFEDISATNMVDTHNDHPSKRLFKKIFTPKQLLMVESTFEGDNSEQMRYAYDAFGATLSDKESELCFSFFKRNFPRKRKFSDDFRLRAIMENIIKNKGVFIP